MKINSFFGKVSLFFVGILCNASFLFAQIAEGGTPAGFAYQEELQLRSNKIPFTAPINFDVATLKAEDKMAEEDGVLLRTSVIIPADLHLGNAGEWLVLPDSIKIWRLTIKAPDAIAVMLYYDRFFIPDGGKLFIYNADRTHLLGAYTSKTNPGDRKFATEFVAGDEIILEYNEPLSAGNLKPDIRISGIGYGYNYLEVFPIVSGIFDKLPGIFNQNCQVNINCPEGNNWQDHKKGVAKTVAPFGNSGYLCSGTLINNTAQDLTPYYLSAHHCFADSRIEFDKMIFYFHYESEGCETTQPPGTKTLVGAQMLVDLPIKGSSDGALLKLNDNIPADYNVFYNGWDRRNMAATSGVSIHHPKGEIKKIATFTLPVTHSRWSGQDGPGAADAHWEVDFAKTQSGYSQTEGGSSGSPLFNQTGLVVGTLTGGTAANCTSGSTNYYGKLWYHWDNANALSGSTRTMKYYLDPLNSGVETLPGIYNAASGNTDLVALAVNPGELTPAFNANRTGYSVNVPNNVDRITVSATPAANNATVTGTGSHTLNVGNNTIRVVVTAPGNSISKTYTITVNRAILIAPDKYEPNNTITQAYSLPVSFINDTASVKTTGSNFHNQSDIDYYKIELQTGHNYVISVWLYDLHSNDDANTCTVDAKFKYSTNGTGWSAEFDDLIPGNIVLINGGTVYFRVDPFVEGDMGSYLLNLFIERKTAGDNNNAELSALSLNTGTFLPPFSPGKTDYFVTVGYSISGVIVTATASDPNAVVEGVGYHPVQVGNNSIRVVVTAQNGIARKIYNIAVTRNTRAGSDANLLTLAIDPGTLYPRFNSLFPASSYTATVGNAVTQINVDATPTDEYATVSGVGDHYLNEGNNEINIVVMAENSSTFRTYKINVTRAPVGNIKVDTHQPLVVWPNPAHEQITVSGLTGSGLLTIFDTVGRERIRQPVTSFEEIIFVRSLSPGIYFIRIAEKDAIHTIKVTIK